MDNLKEKWKKLSLTEAEGKQIIISEDWVEAKTKKGDSCIVGKLHVEWVINKEMVKNTMSKI